MVLEETVEVASLMQDVFLQYQGPDFSEEGKEIFLSEFSHQKIEERFKSGELFLVALYQPKNSWSDCRKRFLPYLWTVGGSSSPSERYCHASLEKSA
jgi:hypothetical protein